MGGLPLWKVLGDPLVEEKMQKSYAIQTQGSCTRRKTCGTWLTNMWLKTFLIQIIAFQSVISLSTEAGRFLPLISSLSLPLVTALLF